MSSRCDMSRVKHVAIFQIPLSRLDISLSRTAPKSGPLIPADLMHAPFHALVDY
jgi:hypothetical protein